MEIALRLGDCRERLLELPDESVDAFISDPPYDLLSASRKGSPRNNVADPSSPWSAGAGAGVGGFMGQAWDATGVAFDPEFWVEVYRVLKPGGVVKAFGGTRTFHRMAVALGQAGFVGLTFDAWTYGSGFPKSYNVAQSLEKLATLGKARRPDRDLGGRTRHRWSGDKDGTLIADTGGQVELTTALAKKWKGYGTALKPAWEPVLVAYKPEA